MNRPQTAPRLAVVGCGRYGALHLKIYDELTRMGRVQLAAAVDLDAKRRQQVTREYKIRVYADLDEMLRRERPDGVSIATPDPFHKSAALAAVKSGGHLFVEKPLATTSADARAIIAAAKKHRRLLQVDFHKRYDTGLQALREAVLGGKLGELLYGYVYIEDRIEVPRDWFAAWAARSSSNWFIGVHFYDVIRWATGQDPVAVRATRQIKKLRAIGVRSPDAVQAHLTFANGAEITVHTSWVLPDNYEALVNQGLRLVGTEGLIEFDMQDRGLRLASAREKQQRLILSDWMREVPGPFGGVKTVGYGAEAVKHFAENMIALKNGATPRDLEGTYPGGADGLWATRVAEAADRSCAARGRTVRL